MADLERMINIIFNGEDRTSGAFTSVTGSFNKLSTEVEAMAAPFAKIADDILKLDAALAAMAIGGMAYAIAKAGEFNAATANISTLVHDTAYDVNAFREQILNYAVDSTQSISQINAAIYEALSTGESWENALASLSAAEKLAVAGQGELTSSLLLLLQTMNAYGSTFDEAERYSDVFFKTVELGVIKIPELAAGLSQVSTMAANAGVPIETVGAAIAELTAKGMPAGEAITALRAIIKDMIEPAQNNREAMAALGIEYGSSAIEAKGLEGVLLDMYEATGGNIDQMAQLFGRIEGLNGALALTARDGGASFLAKLEEMRNASGATADAYELMVQNFEYINQRLINTMQAAFITAGQPLLDDWAGLASALGEIFKSLRISLNEGAFNEVYAMIEQFAAQFTAYIDGIAKALPEALSRVDFGGLTDAIGELADAFADYLGGIDLTKPEDLATALQTVADIMTGLINVTQGMVEAFRPYAQAIADFFIQIAKGDAEAQKSFGEFLATAKMVSMAGLEITLLLATLGQAGTDWGAAFSLAVNSVSFVLESFQLLFRGVALMVVEAARGINAALDLLTLGQVSFFKNAETALKEYELKIIDALHIDTHQATEDLEGMGSAFVGVVGSIGNFLLGTSQAAEAVRGLSEDIRTIPESLAIEIQADMDRSKLDEELARLPETKYINIIPVVNETAEQRELDRWASEAKYIGIIPTVDPNAKAEVDKLLASKEVEWQAKLDIAKVEANAEIVKEQLETIQNSVEWKAKLDIAEVEANAKVIEAAFGTMSAAFSSSGEIISSALGALAKYDDVFDITGNREFIKGVIESELAIRERAMNASEALIAKQIEFMNAKLQSMVKGQALIQIDGAGLQPHLEAFMWEILSAIQTRVNEEGHAMLFGL